MKHRKANPKEEFNSPRVAPDIPNDLPVAQDAIQLFREREITIRECRINDLTIQDLSEKALKIES